MSTNLVLYAAAPTASDLVLDDSSRPVNIGAASVGQATVSGTLGRRAAGGGVSAGGSGVTGSLNYVAGLAVATQAGAIVDGDLDVAYALGGVSEASALVDANVGVAFAAMSETIFGVAAVQAGLAVQRPLVGQASGSASVTADMLRAVLVEALAAGGADVSAALAVRIGIAASLVAQAVVDGSVTVDYALAEVVTAAASASGTLLAVKHLVADEVAGRALVVGLLRRTRGFGGTSHGAAVVVPPTLYAPTLVMARLAGSRAARTGTADTFTDLDLIGVHTTRARVGTMQVFGGGALIVGGAPALRDRVGTVQSTAVDVTVFTIAADSIRGRSGVTQTQVDPVGRPSSTRTRVGTVVARAVDAVVTHLKGLRSRGGTTTPVVEVHPPPSNDEIAGAITLDSAGGAISFDTSYATANAYEPPWPGGAAQRSLWYRYIAPADGTLRIFTGPTNGGNGPYIATRLGLYSSPALDDYDYNDLTQIIAVAGVGTYDPAGAASLIAQPVLAGDFLWVRVDAASAARYDDLAADEVAPYGVGPGVLGWEFVPSELVATGVPVGSELDGIIAPGNLVITVGNLQPAVTVQFAVDSDDAADAVDSLDVPDIGALINASVWLPDPLAVGGHTLYGIVNGVPAFTIPFTVVSEPALDTEDSDVDPILIPRQGVQRWIFQDPTGAESPAGDASWIVPLNPKQMNTPFRARKVTSDTFVGVGGDPVIWESDGDIPEWKFSGTILDGDTSDPTSHLSLLQYFADLPYTIYIIDHFNRAWAVYVESLEVVPAGTTQHPFRHTYTMTALALRAPVQLTLADSPATPF